MVLTIGVEGSLSIEVTQRRDGQASLLRLELRQAQELSAVADNACLIPEMHEAASLVAFFEGIASLHWSGWAGTKSWSSLEHNLSIEAAWHRTGGATLRVRLRPEGQRWDARGTIEVDDMALERLGPAARAALLQPPSTS